MIIDAHSHILSLGRGSGVHPGVRTRGLALHLSQHGPAALASHAHRTGVGGERLHAQGMAGHRARGSRRAIIPGFDKVVVLAISPQYPRGPPDRNRRPRPTVLGSGEPEEPRTLQRLHRGRRARRPGTIHRVRVGEPAYAGVEAAVEELERAVTELRLCPD